MTEAEKSQRRMRLVAFTYQTEIIHRDRSSSETPSVPVTRFNIERTDSKTRAASSPPVTYLNSGRSEVHGFICESINFFHQFCDVEPIMDENFAGHT
jgi:hypothetical protein